MLLAGLYAPASFMSHFIVFVLSVLRRLPGDLERLAFAAHAADGGHERDFVDHHPGRADADRVGQAWLVIILAALSVFMAGINIFGGFMVTRRMLAMFQKS
jgi:NAD(P) transhydrogenase subunit alpha